MTDIVVAKFEASMQTSHNVVKAALFIPGLSASGILTFVGQLMTKDNISPLIIEHLFTSLGLFAASILISFVGTGLTYFSQLCTSMNKDCPALVLMGFAVLSISISCFINAFAYYTIYKIVFIF